MEKGQNCWEFMNCGREPGGAKANELGVCPAATDASFSGVNDGLNSGRFCWYIAGTLCGGQPQGTFAQKSLNCMNCTFYAQVVQEQRQSGDLVVNPSQLKDLRSD